MLKLPTCLSFDDHHDHHHDYQDNENHDEDSLLGIEINWRQNRTYHIYNDMWSVSLSHLLSHLICDLQLSHGAPNEPSAKRHQHGAPNDLSAKTSPTRGVK